MNDAAGDMTARAAMTELGFELGPIHPFNGRHDEPPPGHSFVAVEISPLMEVGVGNACRAFRRAVAVAVPGDEEAAIEARLAQMLQGHLELIEKAVDVSASRGAQQRADLEAIVARVRPIVRRVPACRR